MTEQTCHSEITYFAPSLEGYIPADTRYWDTPMRLSRHGAEHEAASILSYGQYFKGITEVISRDRHRHLADAASRNVRDDISPADMEEIRIFAEKHGSDYHPARIEVFSGGACVSFVMNVAVTERGQARLYNEFHVLQKLGGKYDYSLLPRVYFQGEAHVRNGEEGGGETPLPMFLADWFEGYHEFHLSVDSRDGTQKVVLWEGNRGKRYLDACQVRQVYAQAARIMTLFYDFETFEQIFPWHHAAGDFIVKAENDSVDVKLITARQYAPMMERSAEISGLDALLFFLLNLSLRMRLDRLDGVGDIGWADDECVNATLKGFLEGLKEKEHQGLNAVGLVDAFFKHCTHLGKEDLSERFFALVDACNPAAPDIPVIRNHLEHHIATFREAVQGLNAPKSTAKNRRTNNH